MKARRDYAKQDWLRKPEPVLEWQKELHNICQRDYITLEEVAKRSGFKVIKPKKPWVIEMRLKEKSS